LKTAGPAPWDCCRGFAERSPDIYVEVWVKQQDAEPGWRFVERSRIHSDHPVGSDLAVDFTITE
jgi:hypothetical protein